MNRHRLRATVLATLLVAAFPGPVAAQSPAASPSIAASPAVSPASSAVPSLSPAPTAAASAQMMPAGTQFDDHAQIPAKAAAALSVSAVEHDGVQVALTSTSRRHGYDTLTTTQVRSRTGDGAWTTATLDTGTAWRAPRGLPSGRGAHPVGVVAGPHGFVATVIQQFWDSALSYRAALAGAVWSSRDGHHWTRYDPRALLGQRVSFLLGPPGVGPDGSYFVAATVAPLDLSGPSKVVVLGSVDGRVWHKTATLSTRWTLDGGAITATADGLLLRGTEYACDSGSTFQVDFSVAAQPLLWAGDPSGGAWKELDTSAGGLLDPQHPVPAKASDCPTAIQDRSDRYGIRGTLYDQIPGVLVAVDGDRVRAAVSRDGRSWHVADLPGAAVANPDLRDVRAQTLVQEPDGSLVLLSLEGWRADGVPRSGGYQVMAWRTTDDGVTWQLLPQARPIELIGPRQTLQSLADGSVMLTDTEFTNVPGAPVKMTNHYLVSVPGPYAPWGTCTLAAGADCRFDVLSDVDAAGMDLSGIDLRASTVTGGDWTGVTLTNARLAFASVDTPLTGADLSGADATQAGFSDLLSGTTLTGTTLAGVSVPLATLVGPARHARTGRVTVLVPAAPPAGSDLNGLDLRGSSFSPADGNTGSLAGADFGGVKLDGASFWHIDLTGAKLGKAMFQRLTFFGPDTICPDGKPAKEGVYDQTACGMKPPKY